MNNYTARLNRAKKYKKMYPFESFWIVQGGPPQYTKKSCSRVSRVFDRLVAKLISIGADASDEAKIKEFRKAVEALNALNQKTPGHNLIETEERHNLCDLLAWIAMGAGMPHSKFPDEEGAASGRDW